MKKREIPTRRQVEEAVDLLVQDNDAGVSVYPDQDGVPLAIVTRCPHCAALFEKFAKLGVLSKVHRRRKRTGHKAYIR